MKTEIEAVEGRNSLALDYFLRASLILINSDFIGNQPDVNLPEPLFQCRFELAEETFVFRRVFHVNKQADIFIRICLFLMNPNSAKGFRKETDGSKLPRQLAVGQQKFFRFDLGAIVIPRGQEYLVTSERHRRGLISELFCKESVLNRAIEAPCLAP